MNSLTPGATACATAPARPRPVATRLGLSITADITSSAACVR